MKIRLMTLACCLVFVFAALPALAEQVEAESFSIQVPEGWHVVSSPDSKVVAIILKDKGFAMTLHVAPTGGKKAADMARQGSKGQGGTPPKKITGMKADAYAYTWTAPQGEKAETRLYVNKRKILTLNIVGDPGPHSDEAEGILATLVSSDPAIDEILEELK